MAKTKKEKVAEKSEIIRKGDFYFEQTALLCAERCITKLWKISGADLVGQPFTYMNSELVAKDIHNDAVEEFIFHAGSDKRIRMNKLQFMNALHREFISEDSKAKIYETMFSDIRKENNIPEDKPMEFSFKQELLISYTREETNKEPISGKLKLVFVHYDNIYNRTDIEFFAVE